MKSNNIDIATKSSERKREDTIKLHLFMALFAYELFIVQSMIYLSLHIISLLTAVEWIAFGCLWIGFGFIGLFLKRPIIAHTKWTLFLAIIVFIIAFALSMTIDTFDPDVLNVPSLISLFSIGVFFLGIYLFGYFFIAKKT